MSRLSRSTLLPGAALASLLFPGAVPYGAAVDWRADVPCGQTLAAPAAAERGGCVYSHCVALPGGQVCSCLPSATSETIDFTWEQDRQPRGRWHVEKWMEDGSNFQVVSVRLGEPPVPGWLVAARISVSLGIGVERWSVRALVNGAVSNEVLAEDYGALAFPTRAAHGRECGLLATRWLTATEPARGEGKYLFARWFRWRDGALSADPARPLIARRLLYRFEEARLAAMGRTPRAPLLWFRQATDAPPPCGDPFCT